VNDEGLEIRRTLGEQLTSMESCASNDWRIVADAGAEDCVVRGLMTRTQEEVSNTLNVCLYDKLARDKTQGQRSYRSKREDAAKLISNSQVQDVPDSVVLVEVGRTLGDADVDWNDTTRRRTSQQLVCNSSKMVGRLGKSASRETTSRSLEMVHTTTLLATRTPHTTVDISHDNVRTKEVES